MLSNPPECAAVGPVGAGAALEGHDDGLFREVYAELRRLAARAMRWERFDHTLQPTALAHEAYLRLVDQREIQWNGDAHFLAIAAMVIRRILLKHAREKRAAKRGAGAATVPLTEADQPCREAVVDVLALNEGLTALSRLNERQGRVVELRYFAGLSIEDTARVLEVSPRTVKSDWRFARAWLQTFLSR